VGFVSEENIFESVVYENIRLSYFSEHDFKISRINRINHKNPINPKIVFRLGHIDGIA
jgi:hypothetical protein